MWRPGHTRRLAPATRAWALALAGALALAQAAGAHASAGPSPGDALAAHRAVSAWIRAAEVPEDAPAADPPGVTAACVTLRLAGSTMGVGAAIAERAEPGRAVWTAARRAWAQASQRADAERDLLRRDRLVEFAQALTVEVQLAGPWTPLPAGTYEYIAMRILPGLQGVAVRAGEREVVVFPGEMLSSNTNPAQAIAAAAGSLGLPPAPLEQLTSKEGATVYRFDVMDLAQIDPRGSAVFLYRGGRVTALSAVTSASLHALAGALAGNLRARLWPGEEPLGLMGTYRPWMGDFAPPVIASPREQALAAYALARAGDCAGDGGEREACRIVARRVLESLTVARANEPDTNAGPVSSAMFVMAVDALWALEARPANDALASLRSRCIVELTSEGASEGLAPAESAVVQCALARAGAESVDGAVDSALRAIFREQAPGQMPSIMPWAGWAEMALAERRARENGDRAIPSAIALREMRRLVHRHQVTPASFGATHPDLVGGVVFTAGESPLPSWQCLRPLAFLATMLRDERLTDDEERAEATAAVVAGLRFLMELTVDETDAHLFPQRDALVGGVRSALWDATMPLDATSMGLVFVCEALESLGASEAE